MFNTRWEKILKEHHIEFTIKDQNKFEIEDIFSLNEESLVVFKEYIRTNLRMNVKPRKYLVKLLRKLHKMNCNIFIITSRKENDQFDCLNNTKKWLRDNNAYYDYLILGNSNKLEECIKHNIDIFIDDKIKHVNAVANANIKAFLFDNVYNKTSSLPRINSFKELLNIIVKFKYK